MNVVLENEYSTATLFDISGKTTCTVTVTLALQVVETRC